MPKTKRVLLLLVEGPSDESALLQPMQSAIDATLGPESDIAMSEAFHCDVTTVGLFPENSPIAACKRVRDTVRQFLLDRIESKHLYEWRDLAKVVHVVDLDGTFVPDERIKKSNTGELLYQNDCIETGDVAFILRRNHEKANAIKELLSIHELTFKKKKIPYQVYFMSRNLEHALYGIQKDCSNRDKERLAAAFALRYQSKPSEFIRFLKSNPVLAPGDNLQETWDYVQTAMHSLERGTNLGLLFNDPLDREA